MSKAIDDHHDVILLKHAYNFVQNGTTSALLTSLRNLVSEHEAERVDRCINLVAAEAPSSKEVRAMLATDLGSRASGGAIGRDNRYFTGLDAADRIESLCIALLRHLFESSFADPRLLGGLHATNVVYAALRQPYASLMSIAPTCGGDTSNRKNGPPGVLRYDISDIPMVRGTLDIDLDAFEAKARDIRPDVVSLGAGLNLFPFPVREIKNIISPWSGVLYFDAAHQGGLISGGAYPNPLNEGADIISCSSGKTFSGPQGGFICWNSEPLTDRIYKTIFPMLTGTHQLNRVAALALSCLEMREFGRDYMAKVVQNAKLLCRSHHVEGFEVLYPDRDYTQTHQVAVKLDGNSDGHSAALRLAEVGIIANKVCLPGDSENAPTGLRFGLVEATRLGMDGQGVIDTAKLISDTLLNRSSIEIVAAKVASLKSSYNSMRYAFDESTGNEYSLHS